MAYEPTIWKDRAVEKPRTFTIQNNPDESVTLVPAPGTIVEPGTPVNAANLNKLEQAVKTHEADKVKHIVEIANFKLNTATAQVDILINEDYEQFELTIFGTGASESNPFLIVNFNDDVASNYSYRTTGGGDNKNYIQLGQFLLSSINPSISVINICNMEGFEKTLFGTYTNLYTGTTATIGGLFGKWTNTTNKINKMSFKTAQGIHIPKDTRFRLVGVL